MSKGSALLKLFQQLDEAQRVMFNLQKRPYHYLGVQLYANESQTLNEIAVGEGLSQMELSARMLRTKGATSAAVDRLVSKKLVRRDRPEADQRRTLLTLTELGRQVNEAHIQHQRDLAYTLAEQLPLTLADLEAANRVLSVLAAHYAGAAERADTQEG